MDLFALVLALLTLGLCLHLNLRLAALERSHADWKQLAHRLHADIDMLGVRIRNLQDDFVRLETPEHYPVSGIKDISELLGVTSGEAYRALRSGDFPAKKVKGTYCMTNHDLETAQDFLRSFQLIPDPAVRAVTH